MDTEMFLEDIRKIMVKYGYQCRDMADEIVQAALEAAQQQGHFDRKRFERAPCYLCGYNGEGYYQPDKHPCAARYHAKQPATAVEADRKRRGVPVAGSLDFEAMHTPFGIHAPPQQADKVRDLEAKMIEALTELCDEIDRHEIHTAISETSISWFKRRAREALAALKGE